MAIEVTCPSCTGAFNAPEAAAGKQAKCPQCGDEIQIPGALAAVAANYGVVGAATGSVPASGIELVGDDAAPAADTISRRPCPMCGEMIARDAVKCRFCGEVFDAALAGVLGGPGNAREPGWGTVRVGLMMLYYSSLGAVVAGLLMAAGLYMIGDLKREMAPGAPPRFGAQRDEPPVGAIVLLGVSGVTIFGTFICALVGQGLCVTVPPRSRARGFAIAAFFCIIGYLILSMVASALDDKMVAGPLGLAVLVVGVVGCISFFMFLRRSAAYLDDGELAASVGRYMIFLLVFFACMFVLGFLSGLMRASIIGVIALVFAIVFGLVGFVWYLRLLTSLKLAIDRRMVR